MREPLRAETCFSTPWDAPLVPEFPFTYRNVDVMTLVYRSNPKAISALLPPPLERTSDLVLIHIYNMNDVEWLGCYGECNVMVGARLKGKAEGGYSPYLFLDSDAGLAQGREVHGQPKKLARPCIELRRDLLVGVVERNGIDIITGTMGYKCHRGDLSSLRQKINFVVNLNYKVVPHIDGTIAIRQITSRQLVKIKVHECWTGPCTVELRPHVLAPVYKLPIVETIEGYYWRADFTLVEGTVVHDYLKVRGVDRRRVSSTKPRVVPAKES
jgi:acetoacetate decarboxylase